MPEWLTKLAGAIPEAVWLAIAAWIGYELRQWRIWFQSKHGGAPDAQKPSLPPTPNNSAKLVEISRAAGEVT